MRIVFFGTSFFAARILAKLIENKYQIAAIVTRPDRMKGRNLQPSPPPVKEMASKLSLNIPVFQPEKASAPEFADVLKGFEADLFVVVAYGEIIKKILLEMPRLGCINIHASLLPKFRGAAPIQRCLMEGEKESGITIIEMTPQMDAGDMLAIESIPVAEEMTFGELDDELCELSVKLLFKVIGQFQEGKVVKVPQDHALATLAPKLTADEEKIDWNRTAGQIHNQIRALSPFPSAWCQVKIGNDVKRLKIKKSKVVPSPNARPGTLLSFGKEGWTVACGEGALRLLEVQMEGKKAMSAEECIRGIHHPVAMII
ncbi:MAG: methionyl-tRNA formyltransferase [Verrucomicrobia bacterium]|nr:methionyl-tRNA formyltransferase [Verrucomicrobiota bacterium]